ncbi:hypothetical protein M3Y94_00065700 [Aphelenchoides besseyi]|nr:hypothetical protein M3Y94_00065700 [Aphelenchoides besseyi]
MDEKILVEKNVEEVEKKTQTLELTDNRNWDFRAAQYCDFTALDKTMDCTSATEFFNQTNGLGSPAFYEDRKRKELEEKENKGRRITRSQTKKNENEVAQKPVDLVTRMEKMEKLKKQITRRSNQIVVIPDRSDLPSQSTLEKSCRGTFESQCSGC